MYPTTVPQSQEENASVDKSSAGLAHVMNKEIRNRVQMLANIVAAKYELDDLRAHKAEILLAVRNGLPEIRDENGLLQQEQIDGVVKHFEDRGITITVLGMFGGFMYKDAAIQEAINETFVAQQEKVRTEAAFEAQAKKNDRVELEAKATANKQREIAQGEADSVRIQAEAKAAAIKLVAEAASQAGKDPLFLELKKLEVESGRVEKWDGKYPNYLMNLGSGGAPNLLLEVPGK
jgi:regulator of protease activity HflC (stomatin/prohibitin superfamily)